MKMSNNCPFPERHHRLIIYNKCLTNASGTEYGTTKMVCFRNQLYGMMGLFKAYDCLPPGLLIARRNAHGLSEDCIRVNVWFPQGRKQKINIFDVSQFLETID